MCQIGMYACQGRRLINGSFEYLSKSAEWGDVEAHYELSVMYCEAVASFGAGWYWRTPRCQAQSWLYGAGGGGQRNDRIERAVKYWIIAAKLGHDKSIHRQKQCYVNVLVSKEDFVSALRAHQAALDATKIPQREAAQEYMRRTNRD